LIYPPDSSTAIALNPIFSWTAVPNADSYTLQVSTSATFTTQSMIYNTAGLTSTSQQVSGLNPNTLYYWRVRSANGTTQGFYSVKFSFTTGTTIGLDEPGSGIQMTALFPNPVSDVLTVAADVKFSGNYTISIVDLVGKQIYKADEISRNNKLNHEISVNNTASGIYLLSIEMNGSKIIRKISIN
jgi:hypothetical protein